MSETPSNAPSSAPAPDIPVGRPAAALPAPLKALLLALVAGCGISLWLAWQSGQRVHELEQELVRRQQSSQDDAVEAKLAAKQAQDLARDTAARAALVEARVAETTLQRTQLDDLMQSLSRSRDEHLLIDVDASLRVAQQQAALTASAEPLVAALKAADERLARTSQPRLDKVRRALARDLERVRSVALADTASLVIKLDEAMRLVDDLPLPTGRLPLDESPPAAGKATPAAAASAAQAASAPPGWFDGLSAQGSALWDQLTGAVWQETRSLIRVRRIEHPEPLLLTPEQDYFLRENLKLRLLNARMALLSRQYATAQGDVRVVLAALPRYFDPASRKVGITRELLQQVASQSVRAELPRPDDTLAALASVAAGR